LLTIDDVLVLAGGVAARLGPQQDLPGGGLDAAGRQVERRRADLRRDHVEGQPIVLQLLFADLDRDLIGRHAEQLGLGDVGAREQAITHRLGLLAQLTRVQLAVDHHHHHLAPVGELLHHRALGVLGEGDDAVDGGLDVAEHLVEVRAVDDLDQHAAGALVGEADHAAHIVQAVDRLFDRLDDTLLDLRGRRSRIGYGDQYAIELDLGEDLGLDHLGRGEGAADQKEEHQQVGGDGVFRHVADGAAASCSRRCLLCAHRRLPNPSGLAAPAWRACSAWESCRASTRAYGERRSCPISCPSPRL
jgi:hypothetical protein